MTLTLATPTASPITVLPNGLKIIRCADYVGAARGTLSTVSDSLSVAGTVVKDEQALAAATTFTNRFGSVSDSVTIPIADLAMVAGAEYEAFLGLRSTGSTPIGAKAGETWNYYSNNVGPTVQHGSDGTVRFTNTVVPKSIYEHYSLLDLGFFSATAFTGKTNLNIRAWGITSADPISWYLDVLYLVPKFLAGTDDWDLEFYGNFAYYVKQSVSRPATDAVSNDIGQYSVLYQTHDGVFNDGMGMDIQDSNAERTEFDWNGIFFNDPLQTKSYLTIVGAGSRLIKPQSPLSSFDFSTEAGTFTQKYDLPDGFIIIGNRALTVGWEVSGGAWRVKGPTGTQTNNTNHHWAIGQWPQRATFSSSNPSTFAPQMGPLESFILTMKCTLTSGYPTGGAVSMVAGGVSWTNSTSAVIRRLAGIEVRHNTAGTTDARLCYSDGNNTNVLPVDMSGAGFTSVLGGLASGGSYWIKVERRFYHWRAKVWLDGSSEPSSWTLQAYQPIESSLGGSVIQYPWTTGWSGNPAVSALPITLNNNASLTPFAPGGQFWFYNGFNKVSPQYQFAVNSYQVDYDPDPDGSGSFTGAYFNLEKYDGSDDWGTVYVPPGALQVLYTDYAPHHFGGNLIDGTDIHGGNFSAWKEAGAKLAQGAAYSQFFFRRKLQNPATFNKIVPIR